MHVPIELLDCFILAVAMYTWTGRSFCGSFYCSHLWKRYKRSSFSKTRVAYNFYGKISFSRSMENNIPNVECLIRRDIYSFTSMLKTFSNMLISAIKISYLEAWAHWQTVSIEIWNNYNTFIIAYYTCAYRPISRVVIGREVDYRSRPQCL